MFCLQQYLPSWEASLITDPSLREKKRGEKGREGEGREGKGGQGKAREGKENKRERETDEKKKFQKCFQVKLQLP